jgi:hypothetical protein
MPDITATLVSNRPVPIVVIEHTEPDSKWLKPLANSGQIERAVKDLLGVEYFASVMGRGCRGVSLDRLDDVLRGGVDVRPTDSVIFVDHLDKAIEYGAGEEGLLVIVYDKSQLKPASIEFPNSTSAADLNQFAAEYPTRIDDYNGNILLSRCGPNKDAGYGLLYGAWIPDDPFNALRMLLVIAQASNNALATTREAISRETSR